MGAISSKSWVVFDASGRALLILVCCATGSVLSCAETLSGVVYSNEIGNGIHPAGRFELAVGGEIHTVEYGEPLERHFQGEACNDIGAEWSVVVEHIDNSVYASRVTCTGHTHDDVHKPWLLVRNYMEGLPNSVSAVKGLSHRYRSSREFRSFRQEVNSHELSFYYGPGDPAKCLKVISVEPATRADFVANCALELRGNAVALHFDVVRSKDSGDWEIDGIKIR